VFGRGLDDQTSTITIMKGIILMQLAIKIAKVPMYFVGWCVLMMIMGFVTCAVVGGGAWLIGWVLHALAVSQ
jgi:biotin transporter BioY